MDIQSILNGNKEAMDKYANFFANQSSFSSGAARISQSRYQLKKLKMEPGDGLLVVPLMIHLPIAYDGTRLSTGIPYYGDFENTVLLIKWSAEHNAKFNESLQDVLGDKYSAINLSNLTTVSKEEREAFWPYRHPLIYAKTVMTVKAADSQYAFGTPYSVNVATDPETGAYIDDPRNPLIYNLHKLETACLAVKVKKIQQDNEAAGDARRTDADISDQIKRIWENRCITNPYALGTTRVLFFKTDRNYEIDSKLVDKWTVDDGIRKNEYYIKINKYLCETLEGFINSKYDRYSDFLLIKQQTPEFDKNTQGTAAQKISRSAAGLDEAIENMLPGFIDAYKAYRNNIDNWDEKIILMSAFEYRTISDQAISEIFKRSMPEFSAAMRTTEVYTKFGEVIAQLDNKLSDELISSAMSDSLASVGSIQTQVEAAPTITENTPGYGGDTAETEDAASAMVAALIGDDEVASSAVTA